VHLSTFYFLFLLPGNGLTGDFGGGERLDAVANDRIADDERLQRSETTERRDNMSNNFFFFFLKKWKVLAW
jgi:hypothetical protein